MPRETNWARMVDRYLAQQDRSEPVTELAQRSRDTDVQDIMMPLDKDVAMAEDVMMKARTAFGGS